MKRGSGVRHKKRTTRTDVRKQQILRKLIQKQDKYPCSKVRYVNTPVYHNKRSA